MQSVAHVRRLPFHSGNRTRMVFMLLAMGLAIGALVLAGSRWAMRQAMASADESARQIARSHVGLLSSELQKFRLLPLVLSENPEMAAALRGGDPAAEARLNVTLELLAANADADAIYAMDRNGRTVSSSNWRLPTSFVGQQYGFRPYFRDAMRNGNSELFALGTISGRPGLYLARRVSRGHEILGVVVVKVEFDDVEAAWARAPGFTLVTDSHGVILVTSISGWRFMATQALDRATLADARRTLQFGSEPPQRAPLTLSEPLVLATLNGASARYRSASEPAPLIGAHLTHFSPLDPPLAAARTQGLLAVAGLLLLLAIIIGLVVRVAERQRIQREVRARLEEEVAIRTAELREANGRLIVESEERLEADRRYRAAREDLAQASRLGSLGQITAGVAHEINQPVAAIRTFAENAGTFIRRDSPQDALDNLEHITSLTDRIGAITGELRAFARRKLPARGSVALGDVLDGTMLLLGERARGAVTILISQKLQARTVVGDRIRLEQILINLIQNALDAVQAVAVPKVTVTATVSNGRLMLDVIDNGPGIAPEVREALFTPFASAKPGGLGLGLAIARDIARDFGGDLELVPGPPAQTLFRLTLDLE